MKVYGDEVRYFDFSSMQGILSTILGLALVTLIGVGIRMLMMLTIQQRRERMNRQINERLKTLIAAYRTLGGSFTGELTVDPTHLRELRTRGQTPVDMEGSKEGNEGGGKEGSEAGYPDQRQGFDRSRRIRDAVEAALSDIILLGTEEHVRLASQAASDLAAGRPIHTAELVVSLRNFIRAALDLGPIPKDVSIPLQGPTRTQGSSNRGRSGESSGGKGSGQGGGMGAAGGGAGMGLGMGLGMGHHGSDSDHTQ